jgi:hypothetical protein
MSARLSAQANGALRAVFRATPPSPAQHAPELHPVTVSRSAHFFIHDEREAETVLRDAAQEGARIVWSNEDGGTGVGTLKTDGTSLCLDTAEGFKVSGEVRLSFALYGVPVLVESQLEEGRLVGLPRISSSESRTATRVVPTESLKLQWYSMTEDGMRINQAPLLDFGANGARSHHAPGMPIPEKGIFPATIVTSDAFIHCMAEIRSTEQTPLGIELGLKFVAEDPMELAEVVIRTLFPQVKLRRHVPAEELRRLFKETGYHRLRDGSTPTDEWATMDADAVTRDMVYVAEDGAAVAHGSLTRVYRNTWLGHQTAMRSDHPEAARARRILTTMTMLSSLIDGRAARSMAYYEASKPYGRLFFDRFVESVGSPELATITDLDWIDRDELPVVLDTEIPSYISVSVAAPSELAAVVDLVRRQLPELHADAIDARPSLLRSDALHPAYRTSGLSRTREVFVVRSRGHIVGAALCEHTSKHLSLLNELNLAQFFFVRGGVDPRAQRALEQAVRRFYDERAVKNPFVVAAPNTFDLSLDPSNRLAMRIRCITWSFEGLRAYENYLKLRCAWLERGRRPRLKPRLREVVNS